MSELHENKVFYVRGYICESTPTVVMVLAATPEEATIRACERGGVTGILTVIPVEEWKGLNPAERFIIGFKT
jgi:hypothetical protein